MYVPILGLRSHPLVFSPLLLIFASAVSFLAVLGFRLQLKNMFEIHPTFPVNHLVYAHNKQTAGQTFYGTDSVYPTKRT